jgi:hypothetical protein
MRLDARTVSALNLGAKTDAIFFDSVMPGIEALLNNTAICPAVPMTDRQAAANPRRGGAGGATARTETVATGEREVRQKKTKLHFYFRRSTSSALTLEDIEAQ